MLFEGASAAFLELISVLLSGLEVVGLPLDAISALTTIMGFGTWVVGYDIMVIFASTVVFWWSLKFAVGLVIFVWELLPLT